MKLRVGLVLALFLLLAAGAAGQAGPDGRPLDPCRPAPAQDGPGADQANGTGPAERARAEGERDHGQERPPDNGTSAGGNGTADQASRPPGPADPDACEQEQRDRDELAVAYCRQHPHDARCDDVRERLERFCTDHPRARACMPDAAPPGEGHLGAFRACLRAATGNASEEARHRDMCCTTYGGNNQPVQRLCAVQEAVAASLEQGRHVSFEPAQDGMGFTNYTVGDQRVLDRLRYVPAANEPPVTAERVGKRLEVRIGDEGAIAVIDNPTGLISGKGLGSFELRLPENATLEALEEGWRVRGDGWQAVLLAHGLLQSGQDLTAQGFISYHVKPIAPEGRSSSLAGETLERAAAKGHLGAEVSIRRHDPQAPGDGRGAVDVLQYDDVKVEVELPEEAATTDNPIRVEISAELDEGRTIVLDLDPSLLASTAVDRLELRYYDVTYTNGTRHAEEVAFAAASSLDDVMDPTDDDGQAEYWVVSDANGMHVLVSIPHWSIHAVTLASIADVVQDPSVLAGVIAGAAGAVIAAVLLLRPRREDEE